MVALQIAPAVSTDVRRRSFTAPTGSYYMVGTPSVDLANDLVETGIERVVFAAREPEADWMSAEEILRAANIEIVATWKGD